ncbi:uncharacterized protein RJT20DRAFT_125822 [Scheffersomyces xylosifermentans]|uniref:uncharacterized protein n=1 Tax=Scheffersomyces xylosifermentans TaxID=1304137 RepID=UPI00315D5988
MGVMTNATEFPNDLTASSLIPQIDRTLTNLAFKRDALINQSETYNELEKQIQDGKINSDKVMVLLGDGYFVEKSASEAVDFLKRRTNALKTAISQFDNKLKEGTEMKARLLEFEELSKASTKPEHTEKNVNDEGLLYMDIQEELDEDGNVINIKINNEEHNEFIAPKKAQKAAAEEAVLPEASDTVVSLTNEFEYIEEPESLNTRNNGSSPTSESKTPEVGDEEEDQLRELFEDMEIIAKPRKALKEAEVNQEELLDKIDQLNISPDDKFKLKQICIEEYKKLNEKDIPSTKEVAETYTESSSQDASAADISVASLDDVRGQEREEVLASIIKENNLDYSVSSKEIPINDSLAINKSDILELELLADDFDDSQSAAVTYADDEEWDFDFSNEEEDEHFGQGDSDHDDDDDEDDDFADQMLYGDKSSILTPKSNHQMSQMLWERILELRRGTDSSLQKNGDHNVTEKPQKAKKSVRFAESLEINEVENISESLKETHPQPKISLFRQGLIVNKKSDLPTHAERASRDVDESPVLETISERNTEEFDAREQSGAIENKPKKVSRFKQNRLGEAVKKIIVSDTIKPPENDETLNRKDLINQSISENEGDLDSEEQNLLNSDFSVHGDVLERVNTDSPFSGDVIDRSSLPNDKRILEDVQKDSNNLEVTKGKKVSRFRASRSQRTQGEITSEVDHNDGTKASHTGIPDAQKTESNNIKETSMDYRSLQDDTDTMAKAYVLGMYDDDIATEGPVVDKLDDFELLNKMVESMPDKSKESRDEDRKNERLNKSTYDDTFDPMLDEIIGSPDVEEEDEDEDGPILLDEIVENEFDPSEFYDLEEDGSIDSGVINQEVTANYHKLRQKIIFQNNERGFRKTDEELEIEPVDEDGIPIKVSRFKAAKMRY